ELPGTPLIDDGTYEIPPVTYRIPDKPAPKIERTTRLSATVFNVVPTDKTEPIEEEPIDVIVKPFVPDFIPVEPEDPNKTFTIVEDMPEFIGGEIEMLRYLKINTKYPEIEKKLGNQGTVWVSFVVGKDGKIKNTKIERGVSKYLDAEALRVINAMPDWIPGKQRGKAVNVSFNLPVKFILK
ncbi:MAG: energy transducer TonB, partial [Flavobacteriales bacterium CG18_big_fil_WC_8_21_14_2_50_32_9]